MIAISKISLAPRTQNLGEKGSPVQSHLAEEALTKAYHLGYQNNRLELMAYAVLAGGLPLFAVWQKASLRGWLFYARRFCCIYRALCPPVALTKSGRKTHAFFVFYQ
jgi:hypothetical protein